MSKARNGDGGGKQRKVEWGELSSGHAGEVQIKKSRCDMQVSQEAQKTAEGGGAKKEGVKTVWKKREQEAKGGEGIKKENTSSLRQRGRGGTYDIPIKKTQKKKKTKRARRKKKSPSPSLFVRVNGLTGNVRID